MTKFIDELKSHVREKASSPLLASFAFAWALWNYRFLIVLFSSESMTSKFEYIDRQIYPDETSLWLHGLVFPLLTTGAYLFAYPYPARFVYAFWLERRRELRLLQQRVDDETPLTREESRDLRRMARQQVEDVQRELDDARERNAALNERVIQLAAQISNRAGVVASIEPHQQPHSPSALSPEQLRILESVATEVPREISESELLAAARTSSAEAIYNFGQLERLGLLNKSNGPFGSMYRPTHEGLAYLVDRKAARGSK